MFQKFWQLLLFLSVCTHEYVCVHTRHPHTHAHSRLGQGSGSGWGVPGRDTLCRELLLLYFSEQPRGVRAPVCGTHFLTPYVSWEPGGSGMHRQTSGRQGLPHRGSGQILASELSMLRVSCCPFTQTIRPWQEGDKVWVSWTQSFNINMTKELLKKINFHKITLRLWDTKDKVSKKAKNYQLKPSGFLEDAGSFGKFVAFMFDLKCFRRHVASHW